MRPRLAMSAARFSSAFAPAAIPITTIRPLVFSALTFAPEVRCADELQHDVERAVLAEARGLDDRVGAELRDGVAGVGVAHRRDDVRAERVRELDRRGADAAGGAVDDSRSPGRRPACVKIASCAVVKSSGSRRRPGLHASGTGMSWRSWTTASSACPPPPTIPMTRSPSS